MLRLLSVVVLGGLAGCGGSLYRGGASQSSTTASASSEAPVPSSPSPPDVLGSYARPSVTNSGVQGAASSSSGGEPPPEIAAPQDEPASSADEEVYEMSADSAGAVSTGTGIFGGLLEGEPATAEAEAQYAQATPNETPGEPSISAPPAERAATDAIDLSGPLLVYTAAIALAVFEVEASQDAIVESIGSLGGYVAFRSDTQLTVRVPSARFDKALELAGGAGDVLSRNVRAVDVSEEFHDLTVRLANAEAMRKRIEELLGRTANIQEALVLEHELQRITEIIESLKGRIRFLSDRATFSTIDIHFSSIPGESIQAPGGVSLPIEWLKKLGLSTLLDFSREEE